MATELEQKNGPDLKPVIRILGWFLLCYSSSLIAYYGTAQGVWFWYVSLNRPALSPPSWSVTPTSTVVYGLIAWASWDVWNSKASDNRRIGLGLFFAQLILNALWPWFYFVGHAFVPTFVLQELICLFAVANTILFWRVSPRSGGLLIPYVLWAIGWSIITFLTWRMNR